jgi:uncharacterized Zn finger protein (UPF0148 family)
MKCIRCDIDMLPSDMFGNVCPNCGATETEQQAEQKEPAKDERNKPTDNRNSKRPNR